MRSVTSRTAAWNAGSFIVSLSLWMNTDSLTGRSPERSSATSALWDSPENWSTSEMFVVPIAFPAMNTTTTKASQPQNAFLRCRPLQAAMRAARLCFEDEVDMPAPDACVRRRPPWVATGASAECWSRRPCPPPALERTTRPYTRGPSAAGLDQARLASGSLRLLGEQAVAVDNGGREVDELAVV